MVSRIPLPMLAFLLFLPVLASCTGKQLPVERLVFISADGSNVTVDAEVARSQEEQAQGLMGRKHLGEGSGMLFWHNADTRMHFWMKNTVIPLSIAFIDSTGTIREIHDMKPLSVKTISSETSVRYALEVPLGWFERKNIQVGSRLDKESLDLLISSVSLAI